MEQTLASKFWKASVKIEPVVFYLFTLLGILPILIPGYFITVDGPAHLHNSRLILDILQNSNLEEYYKLNTRIFTNISGHLLLSSLLFIFKSAVLAEKMLLCLYILTLPVSFRFLIKQVNDKNRIISWFIFPFVYSILFYYGFYNFNIAIVFLFFTLGLWIKFTQSNLSFKRTLILLLLTISVFISHVFVFAVLLIIIGALNFPKIINLIRSTDSQRKVASKSLLLQISAIIPSLVLFYFYLSGQSSGEGDNIYISLSEKIQSLISVQPAKGVSFGSENKFTRWIFILTIIILGYNLILRVRNTKAAWPKSQLVWGGSLFFFLCCYFAFPDIIGETFGFISTRLLFITYLVGIIFLATLKIPRSILAITVFVLGYITISLTLIYIESARSMKHISTALKQTESYIDPHSTVLPINTTDSWILKHSSNYLGANKPIVVLENYEASLNYFPLKWNWENIPHLHLGGIKEKRFPNYPSGKNNRKTQQIDFVFILSPKDQKSKKYYEINKTVQKTYNLVYKNVSGQIELYKKQ